MDNKFKKIFKAFFIAILLVFFITTGGIFYWKTRLPPEDLQKGKSADRISSPTPPLSSSLLPKEERQDWKKPLSGTYNTPDGLTFTFHEIEVMDINLPFTGEENKLSKEDASLGVKAAVEISVVNNSPDILFIDPADFIVKDELESDLKVYSAASAKEPGLYGELLPNRVIQGYLTFDIPVTAKEITLIRRRTRAFSSFSQSDMLSSEEEYDAFPLQITSTSETTKASNTAAFSEFDRQYLMKTFGFLKTLHLTSCVLIGEKCLGEEELKEGQKISFGRKMEKYYPLYKDGLLGVATTAMASTYTFPPASLSFNLYQFRNSFFSVKETYAQSAGLGMSSLAAFSKLWSVSRNISYSLIIIVLVIAGFFLIFGYKINPNISIDLQKIIGRTVFVILAITFSYAIAGLLIDLMYLLLLMVFNIARQNNLASAEMVESLYGNVTPDQIFQYFLRQGDPWVFANNFISLIPESVLSNAQWILGSILGIQNFPIMASGLRNLATIFEGKLGVVVAEAEFDPGAFIASIASLPLSIALGKVVAGLLIKFILFIGISFALLFLYFKILFILIGSYIEIVFEVIFAPFILLMDFLPGRNYFAGWFKRLAANVITFPLLAILFLAGANLTQAIGQTSGAFLPPPLVGISQQIMASIIGIGILIAIPSMIDRVKKWIIPEYALVNFPATPGAFLGTIASIVPFLPTVANLTNSIYGFKARKDKKQEKEKEGEGEGNKPQNHYFPHMPHRSPVGEA